MAIMASLEARVMVGRVASLMFVADGTVCWYNRCELCRAALLDGTHVALIPCVMVGWVASLVPVADSTPGQIPFWLFKPTMFSPV